MARTLVNHTKHTYPPDSTISCQNIFSDAMAYRGDLISCTVKFELARAGKVPIVFSLNGRQITQNEIFMDYTQNEEFLYPFIGMGHTGIRVLAKVSTHFGIKEAAVMYYTVTSIFIIKDNNNSNDNYFKIIIRQLSLIFISNISPLLIAFNPKLIFYYQLNSAFLPFDG